MPKKALWILGGVILLIAVGAYLILHKSNSNQTSGQSSTTNSANTQTSTTPSAALISTQTSASLGQYLADGNGKTLYTSSADQAGTSNCNGSCAATWPPYQPATAPVSLPANVGTITRADGSLQYTYKSKPLYYFNGDAQVGDTTGNGVGGFQLVKP